MLKMLCEIHKLWKCSGSDFIHPSFILFVLQLNILISTFFSNTIKYLNRVDILKYINLVPATTAWHVLSLWL